MKGKVGALGEMQQRLSRLSCFCNCWKLKLELKINFDYVQQCTTLLRILNIIMTNRLVAFYSLVYIPVLLQTIPKQTLKLNKDKKSCQKLSGGFEVMRTWSSSL